DQAAALGSPCRVHAGDRVAGDGVPDEGAAVLTAAGDVTPGVAVDQRRARFYGADEAADVEAAGLGDVAARVGLLDRAGGELAGEAAGAGLSGDAAAGVAVEDAAAVGGADQATGGFGAFHLAGGGGVPEIAVGAADQATGVVVAAGERAVSVAVLDVAGGFQVADQAAHVAGGGEDAGVAALMPPPASRRLRLHSACLPLTRARTWRLECFAICDWRA